MRNIKLREGSPKAVPRSRLTPDLGARHDVVWDRSRAARHRAHPSGMRTVSSSAHAGRRRPADASCRADMWREDAVLANAGGANSSCGSAKGSSCTRPWRARPRPCYREVAVAGRGGGGVQIKTSPRAVRSGAMRERGAGLMTAAGSVVQCASDTAGPRALSMAPAHLPVAVIRACAESEQQGLAAARRLAPTPKVKASVAQAQPAGNICIGRKHRCWW